MEKHTRFNLLYLAITLLAVGVYAFQRQNVTVSNGILRGFFEAGNTAASPSPRAIRAVTSSGNEIDAATGVSTVNNDHQTTAAPRTILPPKRFASAPLANMSEMYPT